MSSNKKVAIVEETDDSERDYYFVQLPGKKKLGPVLPADLRGQISRASIVTSWNADSSKVALLVCYSAKRSELLLDVRGASGQFKSVELHEPSPREIYKLRNGRAFVEADNAYSTSAVGPWLDKNTVCLVSGEAKLADDELTQKYSYIYVTFKAQVEGRKARIANVQLTGPMADEDTKQFQRKWGTHYFKADGE